MNLIKYLMFFFNFLFWLSGLALIIIGAVIREKYGDQFAFVDTKFANAPIFIIVVGVIVFVIGFLGCCGAVKENYCMVTTFAVLLAVIFLLEIVAGALGISYKGKVNEEATKALGRAKDEYSTKTVPTTFLDWTQKTFDCCGVNGTKDFAGKKNVTNACPGDIAVVGVKSCHAKEKCTEKLYTVGCKDAFTKFLKKNMITIGGVAIGIAFIQLLGIVFACLLMKAIKGEYEVV